MKEALAAMGYLWGGRWSLRCAFEDRCFARTHTPALLRPLLGAPFYVLEAIALPRRFLLSPVDLAADRHCASIRRGWSSAYDRRAPAIDANGACVLAHMSVREGLSSGAPSSSGLRPLRIPLVW